MTAVVLMALVGGFFFLRQKYSGTAVFTPDKVSGGRLRGPQTAPVEIVEFSDFQCPACKKAQPVLADLLARYPDQVKLIFKHFPLRGHPWALLAHQAAECAHREGRFWDYHDRLYAEQEHWSKSTNPAEDFLRYAREVGLELEPFASCLTREEVRQAILADKREGQKLKISSTPTFFINGTRIVGHVELKREGEKIMNDLLSSKASGKQG